MPSLDAFTESLIQEKDKLIQMGALKATKDLSILAEETNDAQVKGRHKGKDKKNIETKPQENQNPSDGASGSKKDKQKRFKKTKFPYIKRGNHPENLCMKKTIDQMSIILEQNSISLPEGTRKNDFGRKNEDNERFHVLKVGLSKSQAFLIDSRASNHMVSSK